MNLLARANNLRTANLSKQLAFFGRELNLLVAGAIGESAEVRGMGDNDPGVSNSQRAQRPMSLSLVTFA